MFFLTITCSFYKKVSYSCISSIYDSRSGTLLISIRRWKPDFFEFLYWFLKQTMVKSSWEHRFLDSWIIWGWCRVISYTVKWFLYRLKRLEPGAQGVNDPAEGLAHESLNETGQRLYVEVEHESSSWEYRISQNSSEPPQFIEERFSGW